MEVVDLIYCGNGNTTLDKIAQQNGFLYGLQLPYRKKLDVPLYFSDQNWKKPDKEKYIECVKKCTPKLATVLDLEYRKQFQEVLNWANDISNFVETIIIIPKVTGVINKLPREINGKPIRLGFSVPTKFGATKLKPKFFNGWEVHLLGGSPEKQLKYAQEMNVVSIDCNYHSMKANKFGEYWTGKIGYGRWWKKLEGDYAPRERSLKAFELSCVNISNAWLNRNKNYTESIDITEEINSIEDIVNISNLMLDKSIR